VRKKLIIFHGSEKYRWNSGYGFKTDGSIQERFRSHPITKGPFDRELYPDVRNLAGAVCLETFGSKSGWNC